MKLFPCWMSLLILALPTQANHDVTIDRSLSVEKKVEFSLDAYDPITIDKAQDNSNARNHSVIASLNPITNRKKVSWTTQTDFLSVLQLYVPSVLDFKNSVQNTSLFEGYREQHKFGIHAKNLENTIGNAQYSMLQQIFFLLQEYQKEKDPISKVTGTITEEKEDEMIEISDPLLQKYINGSYKSSLESWSREIDTEIKFIESSETNIECLAKIASNALKTTASFVENEKKEIAKKTHAVINATVIQIRRKRKFGMDKDSPNKDFNETIKELSKGNKNDSDDPLKQSETWKNAGFEPLDKVSPSQALHFTKLVPIKTYQIRDDRKSELNVLNAYNKKERRTRRHLGVLDNKSAITLMNIENMNNDIDTTETINEESGSKNIDSSFMFAYNLKAIEALADKIEHIKAVFGVIEGFISNRGHLEMGLPTKISNLIKRMEKLNSILNSPAKLKTPLQLASEVAALQNEASLARISLLISRLKHTLRMRKLSSRYEMQKGILTTKEHSRALLKRHEIKMKNDVEVEQFEEETVIESMITIIDALGKFSSMKNESLRELSRIQASLQNEVNRSRVEILMNASKERASESHSMLKINLLGEEARKEIIETIHVMFENVVGSLNYIINTSEGNRLFSFFSAMSAVLIFCVLSIREIVRVGFHIFRSRLLTPRLVREYGNSSFWQNSFPENAFKPLTLNKGLENRLLKICKVTQRAKRRGTPLRNLLLYGAPGNGKTQIARAIAKNACNMPYAIMSGADIAPLGKNGPLELKNLLTWATTRTGGAILIIDEAESALASRLRNEQKNDLEYEKLHSTSNKSTHAGQSYSCDVLNVLLSMTGNASSNLMLILTTSTPSALDAAVLDRMDEIIELRFFEEKERKLFLEREFNERFHIHREDLHYRTSFFNNLKFNNGHKILLVRKSFDVMLSLSHLAKDEMTKSFSSRELIQIFNALESEVYLSEDCTLDAKIWENCTTRMCNNIKSKNMLKKPVN